MTRRELYRAAGWMVTGALVVLGGAWVARRALSPFTALPADTVRLYVGDCQFSAGAFASLRAQPALFDRLVPVPVLDHRSDLAREVCALALPAAARAHRWVSWLPADLACQWLSEDAAAFHERSFVYLPAFSLGDRPIPLSEQPQILRARGITLHHTGGDVRVAAARAPAPTPPSPPSPPSRHRIVNQPIGW